MDSTFRILLIEDDATDAQIVRRALWVPGAPERFRLDHVTTLAEGLERLSKARTDVLLLDLSLPDSHGVETVRRVRDAEEAVPIVVFTAEGDEATALRALQTGAQDYLVKAELSRPLLHRSVHYAIERQRMRRERERLQARLREAQKHESLATFAGGIAHDFNNLLTVVLTNAELVKERLPPDPEVRACIEAVIQASREEARLTNELLTYVSGGGLRRELIDVSALVRRIEILLRPLVGERVSLRLHLADDLLPIEGDPGDIRQLLLNLTANAGEALGDAVGEVSVSSRLVQLGPDEVRDLVGRPEPRRRGFVAVEVRDSGCGMDGEAIARSFDPFYSTKFAGRGLGLAAALGIARSHGGGFRVQSSPGRGSVFTAYLPAAG